MPMEKSEIHLVRGGQAAAALVIGSERDGFRAWLVEEFQAGLEKLSGARLPEGDQAALPGHTPLLVLGGPRCNPLAAQAQELGLADFSSLAPEGYLIRRVELRGRTALLCGGNDEAGDLYAVYALLEHLGLVFQLTGDVVPQPRPDLPLPDLNLRHEPALRHRGLTYYDFCMPWAGLDEFRVLLDQMAKLRMNTLMFFFYAGAPWVEYAVRGEPVLIGDLYPQESGYRTLRLNTQTYTAADMPLGETEFGRQRVGSTEFQECHTPAQAHAEARDLLTAVIRPCPPAPYPDLAGCRGLSRHAPQPRPAR